jgi:hypothetical protein
MNESSLAITYYGVPVPDPCVPLRAELAGLNPSDFPTPAAYRAAAEALAKELSICEMENGELP